MIEDELEIGARNLMLCRRVMFDAAHRESPYTLHNLLSTVRAVDPEAIKSTLPIYAYVEYFGPAGEYEIWIDVVFLGYDEVTDDEETEVATYGPFDVRLAEGRFVQGRSYSLRHIPLFRAGIYGFQLKAAGVFEPLISQRLLVEE